MDLFSTPDAPTLKESVIIEAETCNVFRCSSQHEIKIYPIYSLMHVPVFIMNDSLVHFVLKKKRFNFLCNFSSKCTTFYFSWLQLDWITLINIFRLHFTFGLAIYHLFHNLNPFWWLKYSFIFTLKHIMDVKWVMNSNSHWRLNGCKGKKLEKKVTEFDFLVVSGYKCWV